MEPEMNESARNFQPPNTMRNTTCFQFYARESKADKNGLAHLELSICINAKRCFLNLPLKISPSEFNARKRPKYLEDYIASMRLRINEIITELAVTGTPLTVETIREYLRTGGIKSYTVNDLTTDFMKTVNARPIADEHKNKYHSVCRLVAKYANSEVSSITPEVITKIENVIRKTYAPATACGYLTKLKALIKYAMDNGKLSVNPCQGLKISKPKPDIKMITDEDLRRLINHQFENKSLERVRDAFVFGCGSGLAYIDMAALTTNNFKVIDGYLCVVGKRHKTGMPFCSPLLDYAKDVVVKYHYDLTPLQISNQKINEYLKTVSDICGTSIPLHFHLSRHKFAQTLLNKGIKVEILQRAGGWANSNIIFRHYAKIQDKTIVSEFATKVI